MAKLTSKVLKIGKSALKLAASKSKSYNIRLFLYFSTFTNVMLSITWLCTTFTTHNI